ncbi:hypothetical protein FM076_07765 [Streptomyces albus subsp. chlorinus]|uniref:hypothetical protein n=1 Tax=Streptomyces albus TaxID=1888 RepID=UPI001570B3E3|nr:hypothetical protein [Streptomyces albus]NSC21109.1 hypothetical protein [Streptomyces albus subsp. chlorinus]
MGDSAESGWRSTGQAEPGRGGPVPARHPEPAGWSAERPANAVGIAHMPDVPADVYEDGPLALLPAPKTHLALESTRCPASAELTPRPEHTGMGLSG